MQNSLVIQRGMGKTGVYLLLSRLPSVLLGLIFFFSATQLGLHFWPLSTLVYGVRVDYLSPTLYFLDLLIILYIWIQKLYDFRTLRLVIPLLLTNLLFSANPLATLSWSLHLLLYLIFLTTLFSDPQRKFENLPRRQAGWRIYDLRLILTLTLLFQLLLATTQVWLGHSVGGPMYYLGERTVAVGTPGIALGSFMHEVVLRGYGTFGHPNVLAGWSVVALLIIIQLRKRQNKFENWRIYDLRIVATLFLTILLVILAQSRSAALTLFGLVIPFYLIKNLKMRLLYYFITLLLYYSVFPPLLSPPRFDLSLTQRLDLQGVSSQAIRQYPIFGTGAQASTSTYPTVAPENRLLQPDHNSLTLFLSWFGLSGTLVIIYLILTLYSFKTLRLSAVLPLLPLLLLDHYLLTSPQGLFISLFYFCVALNYTHVKNYRQ